MSLALIVSLFVILTISFALGSCLGLVGYILPLLLIPLALEVFYSEKRENNKGGSASHALRLSSLSLRLILLALAILLLVKLFSLINPYLCVLLIKPDTWIDLISFSLVWLSLVGIFIYVISAILKLIKDE